MRARLPTLAAAVLLATGCAGSGTPGPVAIILGRDACSHCRMAIVSTATAAEIVAPGEEPHLFDNRKEELDAVRSGDADVAMFDLPAAEAIVQSDDELAIAAKLSDTEPIAAALPEGSENTEAVSSAIRAMIADGTLDELAKESLGVSLSESAAEAPILRTSQP